MEYNFYHYPVYTTPYSTDDGDGSFQPEHRRINDDIDLKMFYLRALLQIEHCLHEKLHHVLVLSFGYQGHLDLSNFKQNNKLKKNLDKKLYKNSKIHRDDWLRMDDYLGSHTFGELAILIDSLEELELKRLADYLNITQPEIIVPNLKALNELRNLCAHCAYPITEHKFRTPCIFSDKARRSLKTYPSYINLNPSPTGLCAYTYAVIDFLPVDYRKPFYEKLMQFMSDHRFISLSPEDNPYEWFLCLKWYVDRSSINLDLIPPRLRKGLPQFDKEKTLKALIRLVDWKDCYNTWWEDRNIRSGWRK